MILTVTANPTIDRVYFIDNFEIGKVHRAKRISSSAGGKGINVSRVSKILGRKIGAMGFVGGYTGDFIEQEIEKMGIENLFTNIKGETRTCINISDANGESGEILEVGPEILEEEKNELLNKYSEYIENYDIICVSGSLPKGLTSDFYKDLIRIARKKGKKIIVDTSGKVLEEIIPQKPYMVKPNIDEVSELLGKEISSKEDMREALFYLFAKGVEVPFVTMGKDGAIALINGWCYRFLAPCVNVINAVGSGDSTVAGIAVALDLGYDIEKAIKLGMASGIANTQFEQTGIVTKELVEEFYSKVKVEKI